MRVKKALASHFGSCGGRAAARAKQPSAEQRSAGNTAPVAPSKSTSRQPARISSVDPLLRQSEQRLRVLFDTMDEGVVLISPQGKVIQANAVAQRITGLKQAEMDVFNYFGHRWEVLRPDGTPMPRRERPAARALRERRLIKDTVMGFKRRDATLCWVGVSATPLVNPAGDIESIVITFDDITKRKLAEQALAESEERFRSMFDNAVEGILLVRRDDKAILDANPMMCRMLGYSHEQIVRVNLAALHPEPERAHILAQYETKSRQALALLAEVPVRRKDGRLFYADINPFLVKLGGEDYLAGTYRDVTERRSAEQKLLEQQRQLRALSADLAVAEESERRRIATGLHDDINQMLIAAKLKLTTLSSAADAAAIKKTASDIENYLDATLRMSQSLIFDLVSPVLQKLGLEAAVEELCERMEQQHAIRFRFVSRGAPRPLNNEFEIILFQIVRELLRNAVKHAEAQEVMIVFRRQATALHIAIQDNGRGFDGEADMEGLTPSGGFGLFAIRERMRHLGGTIQIESVRPHGARIRLTVPWPTEEQRS